MTSALFSLIVVQVVVPIFAGQRLSIVGTTIQTMLVVLTIHIASKNLLDPTWSIAQQLMSVRTKLIVKASWGSVVQSLLPIALILLFPTTEAHVSITLYKSNTLKDPQELLILQF